MPDTYDFHGWASRNNIVCSDGRTICKDAFKDQDGTTVPLVWQHCHDNPENVLGHALLENREEGVYVYGSFNDSRMGKHAKELVSHGDITALSIWANKLKEQAGNVLHGKIREVSLVLAGANPGAFIEFPVLEHSENGSEEVEECIVYSGEAPELYHADESKSEEKEESKMADEKKERTVQDVLDEMTEEQKNVVAFLVAQAAGDDEEDEGEEVEHSDNEEGEDEMKYNVFEGEASHSNHLSHDDMKTIFADAKRLGSLKDAVLQHMEDGVLAHDDERSDDPTRGIVTPGSGDATQYGVYPIDWLFPEYKNLNNPPEFIKRDMNWVSKVMNGAHHIPFSRIKSTFANITEDEARALGYIKGNQKKNEVFSLLKRTTDPQTVYKKQKMDRDDIIDITDFDVVAWLKSEMRMMLDEELARAVLIGDGRLASDDDHISEDHIRSVANDADLFTIKVGVDMAGQDPYKELIKAVLRARKNYKGSGNPTFFTTEDVLTEMLLLEDGIGHPLYADEAALARKLRVSSIVTVPVMEGAKTSAGKDLLGLIVNMADYNIGADKGGAVNMFDDFDINYNQYLYLIETRISGALVKPYSAIALYHSGTGSY